MNINEMIRYNHYTTVVAGGKFDSWTGPNPYRDPKSRHQAIERAKVLQAQGHAAYPVVVQQISEEPEPAAIDKGYKEIFETLRRAFEHGDVCIMPWVDNGTGRKVITVCATNRHEDGTTSFVPLAKLFRENPYEEIAPPID